MDEDEELLGEDIEDLTMPELGGGGGRGRARRVSECSVDSEDAGSIEEWVAADDDGDCEADCYVEGDMYLDELTGRRVRACDRTKYLMSECERLEAEHEARKKANAMCGATRLARTIYELELRALMAAGKA